MEFDPKELKKLYIPHHDSHKGDNGRVLIIGGSKLFHAASLWALEVASRIVDMVFYSSVPENNRIVEKEKEEFRNGIVVPRTKLNHYIEETDAVLIGPGMPREDGVEEGDDDTKELTESLLKKYPAKKWIIDGGSLQSIDPATIPENAIITPHHKEFETLFKVPGDESSVKEMAGKYKCIILLKGEVDLVCGPFDSAQAVRGSEESSGSRRGEIRCVRISGGNAGMTKGGTGDVLAGLVASIYAKNDAFLAASSASYIIKKAGESLAKRVGIYFNASDLAKEIPIAMKELIL
jgi:NAD(P)H-hydrate epimerase